MKYLLLPFSLFVVLIFSFQKTSKPITTLKAMKKALKEGYSFVPGGITLMEGDTVSCQGFFMMKGEVTNFHYLEFLNYLKNSGQQDAYAAALPDTSGWNTAIHNQKFTDYYFNHPAFRDYPVVNITKAQAEKYCEFLTQVWRKNTGNNTLVFRLPYRAEFLRASNGSAFNRPFAWDGPFMRNHTGAFLCNYVRVPDAMISRDSTGAFFVEKPMDYFFTGLDWDADLTAPSKSYYPNEFDLYNLNGNVSEMILDGNFCVGGDWHSAGFQVRNQSIKPFRGSDAYTGFRPVMTFVEKQE